MAGVKVRGEIVAEFVGPVRSGDGCQQRFQLAHFFECLFHAVWFLSPLLDDVAECSQYPASSAVLQLFVCVSQVAQ